MKFSISRNAFINELSNVSRAVPSKATIPVLTGIKLSLSSEGLTLVGSDSEISIESFLSAKDKSYKLQIEETGSIVLTARLFIEIIRKLPTDTVTIESDRTNQVTITSGQALFTLNGLDGSTYPHLPEINSEDRLSIPTIPFKNLINQTIFSASNQETRPILTGLHLILRENYLRGVATDSHRLSQRDIPIALNKGDIAYDSLTIPKKSVTELTRIVEDDQNLELIISDKQIIFFVDNTTIYSRLLEGNYPETDGLIPKEYESRIVVNSDVFLQAIERASLISHQGKNNVVQLNYDGENVTLSVRGNERGQVKEEIEVKSIEGEAISIAFNPDYMKDALNSFEGVDINIDIQSAVRPMLLTPAEESEVPHNHLLQLLTPIRTHDTF